MSTIKKEKEKVYKEIAQRIEREKELSVIQRKMEMKRLLRDRDAKNLRPKKVKNGSKVAAPVYKFQYKRKK